MVRERLGVRVAQQLLLVWEVRWSRRLISVCFVRLLGFQTLATNEVLLIELMEIGNIVPRLGFEPKHLTITLSRTT